MSKCSPGVVARATRDARHPAGGPGPGGPATTVRGAGPGPDRSEPCYFSTSTIGAPSAALRTDSQPFLAEDFDA